MTSSGPLAPSPPRRRSGPERLDPLDAGDPRLRGVRVVAALLDDAVEIPGTGWRVGLDPVIGLVPGVGDLVTAIASTWMLVTAWRLGAPASVLTRIVLNLGVDAVIGAIPFAGDVFDFGWKANRRNLRLLEGWLERPRETRRASRLTVAALLLVVALVVAACLYAAWAVVRWSISAVA
ncbi:MAG TPA: DUF4112 domain-containing protein [Anaeromyxobacteraceae bacterium]|nr:DUF4112 domain-containing protein [Anaeromyxobacteraceae bacterium]